MVKTPSCGSSAVTDHQQWLDLLLQIKRQRQENLRNIQRIRGEYAAAVTQYQESKDTKERDRQLMNLEVTGMLKTFELNQLFKDQKRLANRRKLTSAARKRGENALLWKLSQ